MCCTWPPPTRSVCCSATTPRASAPWARWHWLVVIGLGDGLDPRRPRGHDRRLDRRPPDREGLRHLDHRAQIGTAAAIYVAGACLGALFFGHLADRIGRKKLFMITLARLPRGDGRDRVLDDLPLVRRLPLLHRRRHRRRVRGDQLGDRRADPGARPRHASTSSSTAPSGSAPRPAPRCRSSCSTRDLRHRRRLAPRLRPRRDPRPRPSCSSAATCPSRPRWLLIHGRDEEAEALVADIERQVTEYDRPGARGAARLDQDPPAQGDRLRHDREHGLQALPEADRARPLALHRAGLPLQRRSSSPTRSCWTKFYGVGSGSVGLVHRCPSRSATSPGPLLLGRLLRHASGASR